MAGRLLLVTLEAARVDAAHPVSARLSPVRAHRGRHGAPGLRSPTHARLARDLLHDRDGALAYERDGHRVGAHYADKILKGAKPGELPIYLACSSTPRKFFVDVRQFAAAG
jgi:hypothetical protein